MFRDFGGLHFLRVPDFLRERDFLGGVSGLVGGDNSDDGDFLRVSDDDCRIAFLFGDSDRNLCFERGICGDIGWLKVLGCELERR